ncbi:MAG: hypothetical protein Q7T05_04770 [Dehalococcoidia bacterium]|nr:hypothetical protein [Dehalococcoidia bacterium]
MSKLVSRFFRDPADAHEAVKHLISSGYKGHDIGVLTRTEALGKSALGGKVGDIPFHKVGEHLVAAGSIVPVLTKTPGSAGKVSDVLKEALSVNPEIAEYYEDGVATDGVIIVVQADEAKAVEVRAILGLPAPARKAAGVASPGFHTAIKMSATNAVDVTMTGDFRKY